MELVDKCSCVEGDADCPGEVARPSANITGDEGTSAWGCPAAFIPP